MNQYPKFRLIQDDEEKARVMAAIKADNDSLIHPSHLLERRGEIIGAASLAVVPIVMAWNHSRHVTARDSMHIKLVHDAIMETKGHRNYVIACNKRSPYNAHMKRLGYLPIWETEIFVGGVATP